MRILGHVSDTIQILSIPSTLTTLEKQFLKEGWENLEEVTVAEGNEVSYRIHSSEGSLGEQVAREHEIRWIKTE